MNDLNPNETSGLEPYGEAAQTAPSPEANEPKTNALKKKIAAGVLAAVLLIGGGTGVYVATKPDDTAIVAEAAASNGTAPTGAPGNFGGFTSGMIASIDGTSLTVSASNGTSTTVTVSDDTTYTKTTTGSLNDIAVGDNLSVRGATGTDDAITATAITDTGDVAATTAGMGMGGGPMGGTPPSGNQTGGGTPPDATPPDGAAPQGGTPPTGAMGGGFGGGTIGTVKSIDGSTIVLTTSDGDKTITTSSATTVNITTAIELDDLSEGETITVQGSTSDDGVVAASQVRAGVVPEMGNRNRATTSTTVASA